jgi:hypothetical protein
MYDKIVARWIAGKVTEAQVDLLVRCGYLTLGQGETIKDTAQNSA